MTETGQASSLVKAKALISAGLARHTGSKLVKIWLTVLPVSCRRTIIFASDFQMALAEKK